jgi:16S rRNA (guanine(966)-N(2))-methyltransferase RsmD
MRVISGSAKGIFLKTRSNDDLRPTSSKVKEALFNILGSAVPDCSFLDCFAGTGTIGIEALSRGARKCAFIERDRSVLPLLHHNLGLTSFNEKSRVLPTDISRGLDILRGSAFDLIFVDPPYRYNDYEKVLHAIVEKEIIGSDGFIVVEHYHKTEIKYCDKELSRARYEKYGQTSLTFLRYVRD